MNYYILTLFDNVINSYINESIIKRAIDKELINVEVINIRDFSKNKHKKVDDTPYGGGGGMIINPIVLSDSIEYVLNKINGSYEIIYMSPRGKLFNHSIAKEYSNKCNNYIVICGHYEGIDERVIEEYNITEISVGDYVLTGGELASLVFLDATCRLKENVISSQSLEFESHSNGLLEYSQYTKPLEFRGRKVPEVLVNGNHAKINEFRLNDSLRITQKNRPDMIKKEGNTNGHN